MKVEAIVSKGAFPPTEFPLIAIMLKKDEYKVLLSEILAAGMNSLYCKREKQ